MVIASYLASKSNRRISLPVLPFWTELIWLSRRVTAGAAALLELGLFGRMDYYVRRRLAGWRICYAAHTQTHPWSAVKGRLPLLRIGEASLMKRGSMK